ncbi:uncharacterized protein LOC143536472 [Bidens hawaiensis]|uniref:uncharacterized protein LOC143536472 n=1 Tax=Bidens hawaiensis TaxID=980011 RepID=UPI00404B7E06
MLTDGNYSDWKEATQNFLFAKNKIGFVNGSIKKPNEDTSDYMAWMRCNAMIKGWLNAAMEKEIRTSVRVGKKLVDIKDKESLYDFLLGFDPMFGTIRTQILAMQPIPSLIGAYHFVLDDEQKRKEGKYKCGESIERCTFCGKDGHNKEGCFKLIGYPDWWARKGKQEKLKPKAACVDVESLHSRTLIGVGDCKDGLYKMEMMDGKRQAMMTTLDTWHKRLGHPSNSKLPYIGFLQIVSLHSKDFCDPYVKAKITRLPFPISTTKSYACFDLIHYDIWEKGILRQYSSARTLQQNGVVERRNRTLIEATITMLCDSKLPLFFWAKVMKTPYEIVYGHKPTVAHFRAFGCPCTLLNLESTPKFEAKADDCYFVENETDARVGPNWLFDYDKLFKPFNVFPVVDSDNSGGGISAVVDDEEDVPVDTQESPMLSVDPSESLDTTQPSS